MFSSIARVLGLISLTQTSTHMTIKGLDSEIMAKDIRKMWGTSVINKYMFTAVGGSYITIPQFYAVEFLYMLKTLLDDRARTTYSGRRMILKIIDVLQRETWLSNIDVARADILDFSQLSKMTMKPLPHQMEFFKIFNDKVPKYNLKGYLLASPPGSGKTWTCLALGTMLKSDIFIGIVPKNARYRVWDATIKQEFGVSPYVSDPSLSAPPLPGNSHYVFHYEALDKALVLARNLDKTKRIFVYIDECHNFNELSAQRTQLLLDLIKSLGDNAYVVWASGTPVKAMAVETIPLLRSIDPMFTEEVEVSFKKIYGTSSTRAIDILAHRIGLITYKVPDSVVRDEPPVIKEIKVTIPNGKKYTLDVIKQEMRDYIVARTKYYKENMDYYLWVYKDCLAIHEQSLKTDMDKKAFELYKSYSNQIRALGYDPQSMGSMLTYCNDYEAKYILPSLPKDKKKEFEQAKSVYKVLSLKIQGEALGNILGKRRIECNMEILDHIDMKGIIDDAQKKTLIFSNFVDVILKASSILKDKGYNPTLVYGGTNSNLSQIVAEFEKNPDINPLCATYMSLSTAVPMVMANTLIFIDSPFRDHIRSQTIARCARIGQDTTVYVYDCTLDTGEEPNISTRSQDILLWSKAQIEAILGKDTDSREVDVLVHGFMSQNKNWMDGVFTTLKRRFGISDTKV